MGESASARTERELADLRRRIEDDVDALVERVREDVDPRNVVRRQPVASLGAVGSLATVVAVAVTRRVRGARARRPDKEIDRIVEQLGGRGDRLKGRARKRFREQLRKEMVEVEGEKRGPKEAAWAAGMVALTAGATELARRFATRLAGDEEDGTRRA